MTLDVDTTRSSQDGIRAYPPLRLRRIIARLIDAAVAFALACLLVLPFTIGQASEAVALAGFDSVADLLAEWDLGTAATGSVAVALDHLEPVLLGTIYLQALVIWAYDWLSHTATGSTLGKALVRVRVRRHHSGPEPLGTAGVRIRRSWGERALRMALRAAIVVVPPTLAVGTLVAAAFTVPGAGELAELFIALSVVLFITWLAGGVGLHGLATGTRVVGFEWRELTQEAARQIEYHTGHADEYLRTLQEAAGSPRAGRVARRVERDPRVRSALAQGSSLVSEARTRGNTARTTFADGVPSADEASATLRQLAEVYRERGLRGVVESVRQRPPGAGGTA